MTAASPIRLLPWDTAFFGTPIGRFEGDRMDAAAAAACRDQALREALDCVYFLANSDDVESTRNAEDAGFRLVDVRVTLEHSAPAAPAELAPPSCLREALPTDVPALRRIAAVALRQSRFFADPRFPEERCRALYQTWIENSVRGDADLVLVATGDSGVTGFVTGHREPNGGSRLGLLAVEGQGSGLGRRLIGAAVAWSRGIGATTMSVATQGSNERAQRTYRRQGFVTRRVQLWYHWWPQFDPPRPGAPR